MPNIASILKAEITRIARKEVRSEVEGLRKAIATYRTEIAALKRRSQSLEQELRRLAKALPKPKYAPIDESGTALRFSAKSLASQRRRLGLSAEDCGLLLGASGQSVYNWEAGKARPRESHLAAIAGLKRLGKRQAIGVLASRKSER
jgi:DNA-binding transcriptional regulator YiaG